MTSPIHPADDNFDAASSQLDAGLRSCRAVVSNYRSLLAGEGDATDPQAGFCETGEPDEEPSN